MLVCETPVLRLNMRRGHLWLGDVGSSERVAQPVAQRPRYAMDHLHLPPDPTAVTTTVELATTAGHGRPARAMVRVANNRHRGGTPVTQWYMLRASGGDLWRHGPIASGRNWPATTHVVTQDGKPRTTAGMKRLLPSPTPSPWSTLHLGLRHGTFTTSEPDPQLLISPDARPLAYALEPATPIRKNSPPLCTTDWWIPSLTPPEMRKVQLRSSALVTGIRR